MTEKTELDSSVEQVTHAVAEITKMDEVIAELHNKYAGVIFDVDTPKGMKAAKEARKEIRDPRYLIENMRKAGKKPILALGKQLDGKAREMTERLFEVETPIDDAIKEEESRAERERQAKIDAELERVEGIQARIDDIRRAAEPLAWDSSADDIAAVIASVEGIAVDESFEEFQVPANDAKRAVLADLKERHDAAHEREAEEARIAAEREELEKLRAEQARVEKIREHIADIRSYVGFCQERNLTSEQIAVQIKDLEELDVTENLFVEFLSDAKSAKESTLSTLREMRDAAIEREEAAAKKQAEQDARQKQLDEEAERQAKERAELDRQKKAREAEEAAKAEQDRKARAAAKKRRFPGEQAIVEVLAEHFGVPADVVQGWLVKIRKAA